ncbi:MAG: L-threonylcarbamoyladenylate synthase [Alphaproteobacteria bacterium]
MTTLRKAEPAALAEAAAHLRAGRLVAFPTETVYGLGGDATNDRTVADIFRVKRRPQFNPLICHVATTADASALVVWTDMAGRLAEAFWPGPLTLVLPRRADCPVSLLVSAGLDSLAVRVPANEVARDLISRAGVPVAAPSANRSGHLSPTQAADVVSELGSDAAMIIDGGPCTVGLESTVIGLLDETPRLLRPGGLARATIEAVTGPLGRPRPGRITSPGMRLSHYAPARPLRLNVQSAAPGEALLAFGPDAPPEGPTVRNLSPAGDLTEAAANLFRMLRDLDRPEFTAIAVMPVPLHGLGEAINDRLSRAAEAGQPTSRRLD